jgi:hypothetical protein
MDMKEHILAALKEQFNRWELQFVNMSNAQIAVPLAPSHWSTKDVVVHLWAWQQRSIARVEAARSDRAPEFPKWPPELDPNDDSNTDKINKWIYDTHRDQPWIKVQQDWKQGFTRFLELGGGISEKDLLDSGRYPWMNGFPLAITLLASYDHHQEHLDQLTAWLREHGIRKIAG